CQGPKGDPGQEGTQGPPGVATPSLSAVIPQDVWLDRRVDVTISGDQTSFDDQATVSFGDGIQVDSVKAASPSALLATIEVSGNAAPGPRDVTVTDGAEQLVYKAGFNVNPSLTTTAFGTLAQGSLLAVTIDQHDTTSPFDSTAAGSYYTGGTTFPNIA